MSTLDPALLAKLSQLSPAQRQALLQTLKQQNGKAPVAAATNTTIDVLDRTQSGFALSYAQQRLWFQEQLNPDSSAYHIACAIALNGPLRSDLLEQSIKRIIERHESLRTAFIASDSEVKQYLINPVHFALPIIASDEQSLPKQLDADAQQAFDLSLAPLLRCKLYQLAPEHAVLSLVMHHIISDAWSSDILLAEISHIYTALVQGATAVLPALKIQYIDYAAWQKTAPQQAVFEQQQAYWQSQLAHINNIQLPLDKPRPSVMTQNGAEVRLSLEKPLLQSLKQLCQSQKATLYHGLLAAFQCLLYRYTGQNDFAIGTPIAGRAHPDSQSLIGFFVNTQALPCAIAEHDNFLQLLKKVQKSSFDAQSHQDLPFEQLLDHLAISRDASHSPIFQVFFSYQLADYHRQLDLPHIQGEFLTLATHSAKFDLSLVVNGEQCHFEYNSDLFEHASIEQMAQHFKRLLHSICQHSTLAIDALPLLSRDENQAFLHGNHSVYPQKTIPQLFEQQAAKTPDNIAVAQGQEQLSFAQLNQKANQLADYLASHGAQQQAFIAIAMPPCIELCVAMLAVIKLGVAYLPLDPSYPAERLKHMLEQTDSQILLSLHRRPLAALPIEHSIEVDTLALEAYSPDNPLSEIDYHAPLYAIFTSGSTGLPKAALVSHANENNLLHWYSQQYQLSVADKLLVFSAIGFDLTQKNLLAPLCFGAQLHFCPEEQYDPQALLACIEQQQISWLNCAPSAFYPLVQAPNALPQLASLKQVFFGGEPISLDHLNPWLQSEYCHAQVVNMYGPTECTDIACAYRLKAQQNLPVPIGTAAANVELYVLDKHLNLLPQGAIGELYIGGAGLGLGYLNHASANQHSFIANPFKQGETLYKTGDLVRFDLDQQLVFIGRADGQLKIRGFRIELGEIESQLRQIDGVEDAVVCAQMINGQAQLIAFLCSNQALHKKAYYRKSLQKHLPAYMLPVYFAAIDSIPLSANGKIDRKQLPIISAQQLQQSTQVIAARSPVEKTLVAIWQEVLTLDTISIDDNFFELGGNSLSASQVVARIGQHFQLNLPLRSLFEVNTIEALAEVIQAMQQASYAADDDEDFEEGIL